MDPHFSPAVRAAFFAPLVVAAQSASARRSCPELSDDLWLELGVARVLHDPPSGRGFLQQIGPGLPGCPELSLFFETLRSERRLRFVAQAAQTLARQMAALPETLPAELGPFELYAGDGHEHASAAHDTPPPGAQRVPVGHLYALNLRTRALHHLTLAEDHEHDMGAIKRLGAERFRMSTPKGRKVLWVWDRAGINFGLWEHWKRCHGIYFVCRAKAHLCLEVRSQNRFEIADARNHGVLADELVMTRQNTLVRRVRYRPPEGWRGGTAPAEVGVEEALEFLTTELTLPPGVIAWLYLRRWSVEKVFEQLKVKLGEAQAWASSATAKTMQANFLSITHNLLELFARRIEADHQVSDQAGEARAAQRLSAAQTRATQSGRPLNALLTTLRAPLQRGLKLIRWLRLYWLDPAPLIEALAVLRRFYARL
jgi:hypothetical protein